MNKPKQAPQEPSPSLPSNLPLIDLKGKVAVVTGGGGVLCGAMAEYLAACGARTALIGRTEAKLRTTAERIFKAGGTALPVPADVTREDSLLRARTEIHEKFGFCDILLNGAGGNSPAAMTEDEFFEPEHLETRERNFFTLRIPDIEANFRLNFTGVFLSSQIFARDMIRQKEGNIINISSMASLRTITKVPAYSAAKAAVDNFTRWLSVYFSRVNIRVNAVAPGFFPADQNRHLLQNRDGTPTARGEKILRSTPLDRYGRSEELLSTLLYLLSPASSFVTGITIPVDGGFSVYSGV